MSAADRQEEGRIMRAYTYMTIALSALAARVRGDDPERGDVPGWVMITVMTAALVLAILIPFRTAIVAAVTNALTSVTTGG
jgi:hypothetical protein